MILIGPIDKWRMQIYDLMVHPYGTYMDLHGLGLSV